MENILEELETIDKTALTAYMFKNNASNDNFQLWQSIIRPVILDGHLEMVESLIFDRGVIISHIRCRHCGNELKWFDMDIYDAEEAFYTCLFCPSACPILRCNGYETAEILIDLLGKHHPQVIASALKLILISGNLLNSVSPPDVPDDPFKAFKAICDSSPNSLKFGHNKAVIMADIYEDSNLEFPILYLADTLSIPTRYFLHALKYKSNKFNPRGDRSNDHSPDIEIPKYQEEYLIKELIDIANAHIRTGSYLVLGRRLQHLISPVHYINTLKHNLSIVVPFNCLCPLDKHSNRPFDVTENFETIIESAVQVCSVVESIVENELKSMDDEAGYKYLQKHLTAIVWFLTFYGMPFESMLYHIVNSDLL